MKIIGCHILLLVTPVISCNHSNSTSFSLTGVDKLPSQLFNINILKETFLKTLNGAFLDIPNGAISSDDLIEQF